MKVIRKVDVSVLVLLAGCAAVLFWNGEVGGGIIMVGGFIAAAVGRNNHA